MRASISFVQLFPRAVVPVLVLFVVTLAHGQITPSDDAHINIAAPGTNYGGAITLSVVSPSQTTYITFDLSSIPSGYTGANVSKASLKLFVNTVTTAGSFNVDYVNGTWAEKTINANNAPPPGATIAASVPLSKSQALDYVVIDVTTAVVEWLNGSEPNYGIALVANSPLAATFDSKESKTQSHPPELDVVFASGGSGGTITGVVTGPGSGLTGGGTSGTLNLSLLTSCAGNQILQWTGSAWACSNAGTGTITGVTAGTDLIGGGNSGNVTLNLNIGATDARYAQLAAANNFTGNQTVNGNLGTTGWVTGVGFNIGSNPFAFGSYANRNAFLGFAGNTTMTGTNNTATGYQALLSNIGGYQNTADGYVVLKANTTGHDNTGSGNMALFSNTFGNNNTAIGSNALNRNTTGNDNTASGSYALVSNTTGSNNTAGGSNALNHNTTGYQNTATGYFALLMNTTGYANTATGSFALYSNTVGGSNTAVGSSALGSNIGDSVQDGWYNTAVGVNALFYNNDNSGTGGKAAKNTALGYNALYRNTTGSLNTASGFQSLNASTTGSFNTATGAQTLYTNTAGSNNTATGLEALYSNTTGDANTASAEGALMSNTTGDGNTADGLNALYNNTIGSYNAAVGYVALYSNVSGSYLTCVGSYCDIADGLSNATAIGAHAVVGESNSLVLGGTGEWAVNVGIGTSAPSNVLTIGRGLGHPLSDSWETYSSRRWKTNIHKLHGALGKIEQLRGVSYDLKDSGKHEIGVIAEEVGEVVPEVVSYEKNGRDASGVDYGRLTALLIEATKEQQVLIHHQQEQIRVQKVQIEVERKRGDAQQALIVQLPRQVKTIQATLKGNGQSGSAVRTVNAEGTTVRQ